MGHLLNPWFAFHAAGKQHDSAEFIDWLRHAFHGVSREHGKPVSTWEARLEATTEDSGLLYALALFQQTKQGDYTIQDLVNLWHDQNPFHRGFSDSTTTICLQVNRFPTLGIRSSQPVRWNRVSVHLPYFIHAIGWTVRWKHIEIISVVVHRGIEPLNGHYQACLRTGGCRFLTDDWSRAIPCAHNPDLEQDLYLIWMSKNTHLTNAWKSLVNCIPFVPFSSSQEP